MWQNGTLYPFMERGDSVAMVVALIIFAGILVFSLAASEPDGLLNASVPHPAAEGWVFQADSAPLFSDTYVRLAEGSALSGEPLPAVPPPAEPVESGAANTTSVDTGNATVEMPEYDDDILVDLIANTSIPLTMLSVQNVYALYYWDEAGVSDAGSGLADMATGVLERVKPLEISPEREGTRSAFVAALESYASAGNLLREASLLNKTEVDTAFENITAGTDHLREAIDGISDRAPEIPQEVSGIGELAPRLPSASLFRNALPLRQRYTFDDRTGANMVSLIIESARRTGSYQLLGGDHDIATAEPGRMFLLVAVQVTNIGHKGESRTYSIKTPGLGSFTLHYYDATYSPLTVTSSTSYGAPYRTVTLSRYETTEGYLIYDVPASLNVSDACISVNLGDQGSPVWALGKTMQ